MSDDRPLRLGTRTSPLAAWQAEHVAAGLRAAWPGLGVELVPFLTEGDRTLDAPLPEIGGKGVFTLELEAALLDGRIDLAVHSLKDLPTDDPAGLTLGAVTEREDARDAWVCPAGHALADLPEGAVVGTSSLRRASQLLRLRPGLDIRSIRGNVETRIRKAGSPTYAATVLACAGLARLELTHRATALFSFDEMLPAPGQAALAVQVRAGDRAGDALVRERVAALDHAPTRDAVTAERAFLAALGGGCSAPIAALGTPTADGLYVRGRIVSLDGARTVEAEATATGHGVDRAIDLGWRLAELALAGGARALLP